MRRPLLRAAITGVAGLVGPDGAVVEQLGVFEEGIITARVVGGGGLSPTARFPWLVPFLCSLAAVFAIFTAYRRASRECSRGAFRREVGAR